MSNFNEFFKNKGLKTIVDKFLDGVDVFNPKYKITNLKYEIIDEPPYPASYYIENKLTSSHKVKITYDLNDDGKILTTEFEVPKEIDGAFILEGAYRISTNKLGNDYDCRMKLEGAGEHIINFDYDRRYDVDRKILKIKRINPDLGLPDSPIDIPYDEIDNYENQELLRLTERQTKKFQIKLDIDYKPEFITTKLLNDCIAFGDDRIRDLIIDKSIDSVAQGFMQYIFRDNNGRNFWSAKNRIKTYFAKYNKLQDQLNSITTLCYRFWKGTKDASSREIQVPPGVNAINLESLKSKITVPDTVAVNQSMLDLIDVADTPINQNTNLQNSLTISTHLTDDGVLFDVYDKNFNKITIDYFDYLNSKVVASEFVDYETNTIKPSDTGKIEVKHRMKRKLVDKNDYDLIDLHPDYRLSSTTRRIPFLNYTDSVRISMGSSMIKQAIPLANAQRPLVDTGNRDDLNENVLNTHFQYPSGKVIEITEKNVVIELPDKDLVKVPRRTAIQSLNDVAVWTEPKVKVGDLVKQGDIITGSHEIEKDTVKSGINTLVLYSAYKGLVNEDAVVVSESYADKMTSYGIIDVEIDVKTTSALKWIAPIGTKVKSKEPVVTLYKAVKLDAINKMLQENLGASLLKDSEGRDIAEYTAEQNLLVPNNIDEAVVSDVMIQENVKPKFPKQIIKPDYKWVKSSKPVIDEYETTKDRKIIYDKFPEYVASDTLDPVDMDPEQYKTVYKIRVRLIKIHRLVVADKLTNRYGGKGVISAILPDSKMPLVDGKPCDIIMNPYSTINRKIPSVIMECSLGKIAMKIHDLVDVYKKTATGRKKILPLLNKYYPGRFKNIDIEEFIKKHDNSKLEDLYYFNVGCYSKYTPEKIQNMMDELGIKLDSEVMIPEEDTVDFEELKEILTEKEYNDYVSSLPGKFRKVEKPLMSGYVTMEQLYHIPSYSNKVTSDMITNTRSAIPIAPRGKYRTTGQKIGELELNALLSRNAQKFIKSYREDFEVEQNQRFLDNLLGLGLMMRDSKGYAQGGSALKSSMSRMKHKFGLKSGKGGEA